MPVLPVLPGSATGVLLAVLLFLTAEALAVVVETLVAVGLVPAVLEEPVVTRLAVVPEAFLLMLLLDVPLRVGTLLVNTLSELLW